MDSSGFSELLVAKVHNGYVSLIVNTEDKTVATDFSSHDGKYITFSKIGNDYPNYIFTATAIVDGTFNVIDVQGGFKKVTVSAGTIIAQTTGRLIVWI